jgi:hypothetical protein
MEVKTIIPDSTKKGVSSVSSKRKMEIKRTQEISWEK